MRFLFPPHIAQLSHSTSVFPLADFSLSVPPSSTHVFFSFFALVGLVRQNAAATHGRISRRTTGV